MLSEHSISGSSAPPHSARRSPVTAELTEEGEVNGEDGIHSRELKLAKRVSQCSWKGILTAASYPDNVYNEEYILHRVCLF